MSLKVARRARFLWVAALLVAPALTAGQPTGSAAADTVDLTERVAAFRAQLAGSSAGTRSRLLTTLRDDLSDRTAVLEGRITALSGYTLPPADSSSKNRATVALWWEFEGLRAAPVVCRETTGDDCAARAALRLRTLLPAGDTATLVMVQKGGLIVYALSQDDALVDTLRRDTEVRVTVRLLGMFEHTVFAILVDAREVVHDLVCEGGHTYPADSGFTFCPKCGRPLKPTR